MLKKNISFTLRRKIELLIAIAFVGFVSCDGGDDSSSPSELVDAEEVPIVTDDEIGEAAENVRIPRSVDPELAPHLNRFLDEMEARGIPFDVSNLTLVFSQQDNDTAGVCIPSLARVEIDFFFLFNDTHLEELVFHELGHCVLGMEHREDSIMKADGDFIGVNAVTLDEFFNSEFFFAFDVNTNSTPEVRFYQKD